MRGKQLTISQTTLRFRRWSRKTYAAFVSIHRQVTMGCLAAAVAERFQMKQLSLHGWTGEQTNGRCLSDEKGLYPELLEPVGCLKGATGELALYYTLLLSQQLVAGASLYIYKVIRNIIGKAYRYLRKVSVRLSLFINYADRFIKTESSFRRSIVEGRGITVIKSGQTAFI